MSFKIDHFLGINISLIEANVPNFRDHSSGYSMIRIEIMGDFFLLQLAMFSILIILRPEEGPREFEIIVVLLATLMSRN
jgi:hypothetical protein